MKGSGALFTSIHGLMLVLWNERSGALTLFTHTGDFQ